MLYRYILTRAILPALLFSAVYGHFNAVSAQVTGFGAFPRFTNLAEVPVNLCRTYFWGVVNQPVSYPKWINGHAVYINIEPGEIHLFAKTQMGVFLVFGNIEIPVNDPENAIKPAKPDYTWFALLADLKEKLLFYQPDSGILLNLAPLTELRIFPPKVTCFVGTTRHEIPRESLFLNSRFPVPEVPASVSVIIPGFPVLTYILPLNTDKFKPSTDNIRNYLYQYGLHERILNRKANPDRIAGVAKTVFGKAISVETAEAVGTQLGYTETDFLLILGFLITILVCILVTAIFLVASYRKKENITAAVLTRFEKEFNRSVDSNLRSKIKELKAALASMPVATQDHPVASSALDPTLMEQLEKQLAVNLKILEKMDGVEMEMRRFEELAYKIEFLINRTKS
jgi:hypothetical protein